LLLSVGLLLFGLLPSFGLLPIVSIGWLLFVGWLPFFDRPPAGRPLFIGPFKSRQLMLPPEATVNSPGPAMFDGSVEFWNSI